MRRRPIIHIVTVNETIVLCCGVFDVLHAGHLQLLEQARSLGSTLVVGINSDESVRKGPGRPVNTAEDRAAMLRALRVVDRVVVFEEPTPEALIRMLRPDVYVKGGDYRPESLPEAQAVIDIGGTIALLPLLQGYSTTSTLQRLEKQGAPEVTEVMASDVYLNWSWPGIGFGQLSVSTRGDGRIDCGNECMSREAVRLILRAYADHVADSCEMDD